MQEKRYTQEHEWIELSDDGKTGSPTFFSPPLSLTVCTFCNASTSLGTIGVSVYAAKSLGDVVFVELPLLDLKVAAGDSIGAVESVKSASDILTPISGKIIEANDVLQEKPGTINQSPEGEGWIARIEVKDAGEMDGLMSMDEYAKFTAE